VAQQFFVESGQGNWHRHVHKIKNMEELKNKFPFSKGIDLSKQFPLPKKSKLSDQFPYFVRQQAAGSGFLNLANIITTTPVFTPPVPVFFILLPSKVYSTNNVPNIIDLSGFTPLTLTNETDDLTYTSLEWRVTHVESNIVLPLGINQSYTILPLMNDVVQTYDVVLRAFYQNTQGSAYMRIVYRPASIDGISVNASNSRTLFENETSSFSFTNTSIGLYDSYTWTTSGITLPSTGSPVSASFPVTLNQAPVVVTLTLFRNSIPVEMVVQTTSFTVLPKAVPSINGSTTPTTSLYGPVIENDIVSFQFTNTSTGTYDSFTWTTSGITLPNTGSPVSASFSVALNQPPVIVTLTLFRNSIAVATTTETIQFDNVIAAVPIASINGSIGYTISPFGAVDESDLINLSYTNTSTGVWDTILWSATGITLSSTTAVTTNGNVVVLFPAPQSVVVTLSLIRNNVVVATATREVIFNNITQNPIAAINGSSVSSTFNNTTILEGAPDSLLFNNTSTGGPYTSYTWTATGITLPSTGTPVSATYTVPLSRKPNGVVVTLTLFRGAIAKSSVTRTFTYTPIVQYDSYQMTNAFSLINCIPQPQTNATNYSGIHALWIPTAAGVPAIEPTQFFIQTLSVTPVNYQYPVIHGRNTSSTQVFMSIDTALGTTPSTTETIQFYRPLGNLPLSDNMFGNWNQAGGLAGAADAPPTFFMGELSCRLPINTIRNFDAFTIPVPNRLTKTYHTAYSLYLSNSGNVPDATILANTSYFGSNTGRFRQQPGNIHSVTFQIPPGQRIVALITGCLAVNPSNPNPSDGWPLWAIPNGSGYASIFDVTRFVINNRITFAKWTAISTYVGSVIGFYVFNNLLLTAQNSSFTLNPNDTNLTVSPVPVTPGGFFIVNNVKYPTGTTTFPINISNNPLLPNVIQYFTPDNSTTTQVYNRNRDQKILTNAIAMYQTVPSPQTNTTNYAGIAVQFITGVPAVEPTKFRSTDTHSGVLDIFQGKNSSNVTVSHSLDIALTPTSTGDLRILGFQGGNATGPGQGLGFIHTNNTVQATNWSTGFSNVREYEGTSATIWTQPTGHIFFDAFSLPVPINTTKTYITAYESYFSNSSNISTATILQDPVYFDAAQGRYIANQNNLASVTFQLPVGNRYAMVLTGGVLVNLETTPSYGIVSGSSYASLFTITTKVNNRRITLKKAVGTQGSVYGFYAINYN
jgi:hypothetical protein